MFSGREPIRRSFRVKRVRRRPFALPPMSERRRRRKEEGETARATATARGTAAAMAGVKAANPGRETVVEITGTAERRKAEKVPAAVWRWRADPGDVAENQEAAHQTLATFWEERGHSRYVGQSVLNSRGGGEKENHGDRESVNGR
ncbi:hypothetical protein NDU88_001904 [Pleurodeles waltl]|uniref:Uncharacterized protein n=1 Tax=Pleurodeles waltl TaxID=8319 RepID=A0AAV7NET6_PLEWA|nr:hypothetical protein NDU88_001904 [Pleurodeles waltl]